MNVFTRTRVEREHPMNGEMHRCLVKVVINAVPMKLVMTVVILTVMGGKPLASLAGVNKADTAYNGKKVATEQPPKKEANADYEVPDAAITWDTGRRRSGMVPGNLHYIGYWVLVGLVAVIIATIIISLLITEMSCLKKLVRSKEPEDAMLANRKRLAIADIRVSFQGGVACLLMTLIILGVLVATPLQDMDQAQKLGILASGAGVIGIPVWLHRRAVRWLKEDRQEVKLAKGVEMMLQAADRMASPVEADKARSAAVDEIAKSLGHKAQGYQSLRNLLGRGRRQTPSS